MGVDRQDIKWKDRNKEGMNKGNEGDEMKSLVGVLCKSNGRSRDKEIRTRNR